VLSTLGAKQWHKATLLFLDALWVALMAIPLGISVGIAAIYPLIGILNRLFAAEYHSIDAIPFLHDTPALFIFVIATLSLITIALASLRPALRLFGGTAIEIAKSSNKINVSLKESLLDKLMAKKFGITGRLAATNYINNRRHYRQLSLSLSLSSLILVLFSLMVRYMTSNGVTTDGDPIAKQFYYTVIFVILIIFSVSAFSAFCVLYVSFDRRKGEFAVLRSMGTEDAMLYKMVLLEALYYCVYMLIFIFLGSVVIDVTLYSFIVMGEPRTAFIFPLSEILIALGTVITVTAILCMIMTAVVKKSNIITELKKSY
jgi:ABC-type antimicrobial peptide transport system permease subunit